MHCEHPLALFATTLCLLGSLGYGCCGDSGKVSLILHHDFALVGLFQDI